MTSEYRKLVQSLRKAGWTVEHRGRGGHMTASPPGSKLGVQIPGTPGDRRAFVSTRAKLRRLGWDG